MIESLLIIFISIIVYFFGCVYKSSNQLKKQNVSFNPFKLTYMVYFKLIDFNRNYFRNTLLFDLYMVCAVTCLAQDTTISVSEIKKITRKAMFDK